MKLLFFKNRTLMDSVWHSLFMSIKTVEEFPSIKVSYYKYNFYLKSDSDNFVLERWSTVTLRLYNLLNSRLKTKT